MAMSNRRDEVRVPIQLFLNEYVEDTPRRSMAVNLSPGGIYVSRLLMPFSRRTRVVGLEFELPGTGETIWAKGEVRYDRMDQYFHGTGVLFAAMPRAHARLVRDYVIELREQALRDLLARVRRNRLR